MKKVNVIGAGLAGSEAAYQLAKRGIQVTLYEMKPRQKTPAHHYNGFAELVCSNSLRSNAITNACGLLKQEMREIGSIIMEAADAMQVPAGSALAVDREGFSNYITDKIKNYPNIQVVEQELDILPEGPTIVATGPLTSQPLMEKIMELLEKQSCYFYDAAAPIITAESIDFNVAYKKSRYDKGSADYINCPMNKEQFDAFYQAVLEADTVPIKNFEQEVYFEGCMPFEIMAKRGRETLLFGPMKPVGLGIGDQRPYAVVQLRQDNAQASLYNIVGFQTHLTWPSQKKVIQMIPGLENAEIIRYGVMHRNTFINSPRCLNPTYQCKKREDLFFAGQMTGVEGYIESAASGMLAGINMAHYVNGEPFAQLDARTMIGAMAQYITSASHDHFQPMNANFGIFYLESEPSKKDRKEAYGKQSLAIIKEKVMNHEL